MQDDDERIFEDREHDNNTHIEEQEQSAAYDLTLDAMVNPVVIKQEPKKGFFTRIEGGLFSLMRGKKKSKQEPYAAEGQKATPTREEPQSISTKSDTVQDTVEPEPEVHDVEDLFEAPAKPEGPVSSRGVASTIRNAIPKNPLGISSKIFSRVIYLAILCYGVFMISSELPTHPSLVIGIVLVAAGANVLAKES